MKQSVTRLQESPSVKKCDQGRDARRRHWVGLFAATLALLAMGGFGLASAPHTAFGSGTPGTVAAAQPLAFGMSFGDPLTWAGDGSLAAQMDDAKALGVKWVRVDLRWSVIQPFSKSQYSWTRFDRIVSAARARGLSVLPVVSFTPPWARSKHATSDDWAPRHPRQFAAFAAAAVRRYAPLGIHTWEIWNEPNNSAFWRPKPSPAAYVRLLRPTVRAMRRCDPSVFILSGGLAGEANAGGNMSQLRFLSRICALGANRLVDAIGYHPYSFPVLASDSISWNPWVQIALTSPSFTGILAKYGTPSLPIWITEYGAPTGGPGVEGTRKGYPSGTHPDHVDEAFQASLATDSVAAAKVTPNVRALFWYTDRDSSADPGSNQGYFGLRRVDGSAKPAYFALQEALRQ